MNYRTGETKTARLMRLALITCFVLMIVVPAAGWVWQIYDSFRLHKRVVAQAFEAHGEHLALVRDRLDQAWRQRVKDLDVAGDGALVFAQIVQSGQVDSAVVLNSSGAPLYPSAPKLPVPDLLLTDKEWANARRMERENPLAAAALYEKLARGAGNPSKSARAWGAEARCLLRSGHGVAAAELVMNHFMSRAMEHATGPGGQLIAPNELLLALRQWKPDNPRYLTVARRLRELVVDYSNPELPSSQRLFLMSQMQLLEVPKELSTFPTMEGEELAQQLLEADPRPRGESRFEYGSNAARCQVPEGGTGVPPSIPSRIKQPSPEDWLKKRLRPKNAASESESAASIRHGVWKLGSPNHRVIGLFCDSTVSAWSEKFLQREKLVGSPHLYGLDDPPAADSSPDDGKTRWRLRVSPDLDEILNLEVQQTLSYVNLAFLTLMAAGWLAYLVAQLYREDRALANFKDDVAAMSWHELKTPVSSIQFLTEALLDDPAPAPDKVREFLNLIARDTSRLNFMLVNFLTFLRFDKGKYPFAFSSIPAEEIIQEALDAAGSRFRDPGCELILDIAPDLPAVNADKEALVHVFVNLLDNAYKYTPEQKRIRVRVYAEGGKVQFEIQDNGIGIARDKTKKIFDEFQQGDGDRRLSRRHGGFGLGLSIVKSFVRAHGGVVEVSSEPGQGSTFRVTLDQAKERLV